MQTKKQRKARMDKLDARYSKEVIRRAGGRCEVPGCGATVCEAHHGNNKPTIALRYFIPGGISLCKWLHHPFYQEHKEKFVELFKGLRGEEIWDEVVRLKNRTGMSLDEAERRLEKWEKGSQARQER